MSDKDDLCEGVESLRIWENELEKILFGDISPAAYSGRNHMAIYPTDHIRDIHAEMQDICKGNPTSKDWIRSRP